MFLKLLEPHANALISQQFCDGEVTIDVERHLKAFPREINLTALLNIVNRGMAKFDGMSVAKSDRWLAPRVHSALRLSRREAGDHRVWDFVGVCVLPEYVRWRWESTDRKKRFVATAEYIQAIARLWWGAELTRNGSSYAATPLLYENQDLQNSWARCELFHHRPAALASLAILGKLNGGNFATSDQIRDLVKSFNMALTTTLLDSVAPDPGVDAQAIADWCREAPDETKWYDSEPEGPAELPVQAASLRAVSDLIERVVLKTRFAKRARSRQGPGISVEEPALVSN